MSPKAKTETKETAAREDARQVRVTLSKSLLGRPDKHRRVAKALGLTKTNRSVLHFETVTIKGMLNKISHLLTVEAV